MIFLIEDFLERQTCESLINSIDSADEASGIPDGHLRLAADRKEVSALGLAKTGPPSVLLTLTEVRRRLYQKVNSAVAGGKTLYIEFAVLTMLAKGAGHVAHADNERQRPDGSWEPNHTPFREYTTMLYLNEAGADYEGGTLCFPKIGQQIVPRAGLLVGFRCDRNHTHEVPPVISGARYAMSIWYTRDKARAEQWPST